MAAWRDLGRPFAPGEIGCFASHYVLWQRCLQSQEPFVIMEDDIAVEDGFVRALAAASAPMQIPIATARPQREGDNSAPVVSVNEELEVVSLASGTFGTQCYALSNAGARALLAHGAVWSLPVDIYLDRTEIHGLGSFGLRPYFVTHGDQTAYPSLIGDQRYGPWPENPLPKIRSQVRRFVAERLLAGGRRRVMLRHVIAMRPADAGLGTYSR